MPRLAIGVPRSADPEEESLSAFVAGEAELPELTHHLGWLWRLVDQASALVNAGARTDLRVVWLGNRGGWPCAGLASASA